MWSHNVCVNLHFSSNNPQFSPPLPLPGLVLEAVKRAGWQLYQASDELKNDRMVVLAAIKQSCSALRYASPQMQADPEVLAAEMGPAAGLN